MSNLEKQSLEKKIFHDCIRFRKLFSFLFVRDSHKYLNCGASFSKREFNRRHRYAARQASQGSDERPHALNFLSRPDAPTVKIGCFYSSEEVRHFGCLAAPHLACTLLVSGFSKLIIALASTVIDTLIIGLFVSIIGHF